MKETTDIITMQYSIWWDLVGGANTLSVDHNNQEVFWIVLGVLQVSGSDLFHESVGDMENKSPQSVIIDVANVGLNIGRLNRLTSHVSSLESHSLVVK